MKKIFRRTAAALLIVASAFTAALVGAAVQIFDGVGDWNTNDDDNQQIAMARAQKRAQINAQKKAGVYIKTFSRSVNAELTDDEISAVTNNIIEVFDVHFDKKIVPLNDRQITILYTATIKAKIDPDGIYDFIKRDSKEKITIIQQNDNLQDEIQKNDALTATLTEKYNRATSQAEKDKIRQQMNDADRDFLANQKFETGNKLYYAKNYSEAIKFYNAALELNPNLDWAYNNRGICHKNLNQYDLAIQNYNKAVEINPNNFEAYYNRGLVFYVQQKYKAAIQDFDKAISLNSRLFPAYNNRGEVYRLLGQFEKAIQDFNTALELHPNLEEAYTNRGVAYQCLNQYERAVKDYDMAISLNPQSFEAYNNRGYTFYLLKRYEQGLKDCNKALELNPNSADCYDSRGCIYFGLKKFDKALEDFNKALKLNPNLAETYYNRVKVYQALGDEKKAKLDFAKAKKLGYNG